MSNKYGFAHQDLETVIIRGKGTHIKKQKERSGETTTQKKYDQLIVTLCVNLMKMEKLSK